MSISVPATDPTGEQAARFAQLVAQKSNGALRIEAFFNGTLAKEAESLTGLQTGTVDLTVIVSSWLESRFPRVQALSLPFLFADHASMWRVLDGEIGRLVESDLAAGGILALAWGAYGVREFELREKRVVEPDDMRGLRIRIVDSPLSVSLYRALSAIPVPIDYSETFVALQQKTIDGTDGGVAALLATKMDKLVRFVSLTDHQMNSAPLLIAKARYDALPAALQRVLRDAARESAPGWRQAVEASGEAAVQEFIKGGGVVSQVDKPAFRRAMQPVYAEFSKRLGTDYVNRVLKLAGT